MEVQTKTANSDSAFTCSYCHSEQSVELYSTVDLFGNHYTINQCHNCKAYFLAPPPSQEVLDKAYGEDYYGNKEVKFANPPLLEKAIDYFRKNRAKRLTRYLKRGDSILDVGCGNGRFLRFLDQLGEYDLHGLEIDGKSAQRALKQTQIELTVGKLESANFQNNQFDAISMYHVFEHLPNQKEVLDIVSNILKPGGVLVMSFPNIASFQSKVFKGKWLHLDPPRHLYFFDPTSFKDHMKTHGFELLKENHISSEQNPYGMVQSILNMVLKKREVLFEHLKGNTTYSKEYSSLSLFFQKVFFVTSFPVFVITDVIMGKLKRGATVEFTFRRKEKN